MCKMGGIAVATLNKLKRRETRVCPELPPRQRRAAQPALAVLTEPAGHIPPFGDTNHQPADRQIQSPATPYQSGASWQHIQRRVATEIDCLATPSTQSPTSPRQTPPYDRHERGNKRGRLAAAWHHKSRLSPLTPVKNHHHCADTEPERTAPQQHCPPTRPATHLSPVHRHGLPHPAG